MRTCYLYRVLPLVIVGLAILGGHAVPGAQRDERTRMLVEQFEAAVALYRQSDVEGARGRLARLSVAEQKVAAAALLDRERSNAARRVGSADEREDRVRRLRAAGALEMEAAAEEVRISNWLTGRDEIKMRFAIAADLFAYVTELSGRTDYAAERWLTAIGNEALARGQFELAPDILAPTCLKNPVFVPLLLTCGIAHETYSVLSHDTGVAVRRPAGPGGMLAEARKSRNESLRLARRFYERAAAFDPADPETAMRLGHVRLRLSEPRESATILERLMARPDLPVRIAYLAKLFLGRVYEQQQRLSDAERLYNEALRVGPTQSALLALAHNAQLQGRSGDGALFAERAATMKTVPDPWWRYFFGQYWLAPELLDSLRREARQ